ncbi:shikimate dehydrogenase family protein [Propionivibrio dicarboxylicus]|uniref:Shikimate dehydrogenase n=1 Tax=Propionivibrio dicarboxylicus TaxID=83767 RepID=A0A1G8HTI2_9RHOO|nr:shikimate dehydrogenase [Propionivibrio dicarboxylicus]SDI09973.1 shikimate dehydrogenase [Propionivibrio dicarboxylicus]
MLSGKSTLIPLLGYPTYAFKAPLVYNPWFEKHNIDAMVIPMGVKAEDYTTTLRSVFNMSNVHGALITMPHKVATVGLVDEVSITAKIAGSCNAILKRPDGSLLGDMFDGSGFVRGIQRNGFKCEGATVLLVGAGGVGSAIAASLAAAGVRAISVYKTRSDAAVNLVARLKEHYPQIDIQLVYSTDVSGFDLIVNGSPLGMKDDDPLPFDLTHLSPGTFVGEVVTKQEITPLLEVARAKGCRYVLGTEMLFEMIPAYLEFFGFGTATPEELKSVARISY